MTNRSCCISHIFATTAGANSEKPAVLHASSHSRSRSFTYARLLSAVRSLASRLRSCAASGVIGIYAPPSADYVAAALSVLSLGGAFLPLDPSWPRARVLSAIAASGVGLVVAGKSSFGLDSSSDWIAQQSSDFRVLWFSIEEEEEEEEDDENEEDFKWPCERREEEKSSFCYVMFTSGSTGRPKGVCGTEQGLLNRFLWMQELYPLSGDEFLLFKTPISFVDHLQEFLSSVLTGCTLVIPPLNEIKRNLFSILDFIKAYSINRLTTVPSLMRAIISALESQHETNALASLTLLVLSGEVLPCSLLVRISKVLQETSVLNLYGSTEVSGDCTYFDCKRLGKILDTETLESVPIGVSIANCEVALVGEDNDDPNHGEIYVSGVCNSSGYYYDSKFVPLKLEKLLQGHIDCGSSADKLYFRTGDFARRLPSGDLVFLGRKDRTVKLNGQRICLEEIEDVLRGHSDVDGAAVISHKFRNEQEQVSSLVAYVILKKDKVEEIYRSDIKSWMAEKLPLAVVPSFVIFVDAFPTTFSGKVDYESLLTEFLVKHVHEENLDVANVNLLQVIKKAFCDVLMIEEVSDDDDFFALGGNSIAAAHLSNNQGFDMRLLYQFPSPNKLYAALLAKKRSQDLDSVGDPLKTESELKSSRTIHGEYENDGPKSKRLKLEPKMDDHVERLAPLNGFPWNSTSERFSCSLSRGNKVIYGRNIGMEDIINQKCAEVQRNAIVSIQQMWKVNTGSCVDASPLLLFQGPKIFIFIGSHSHEFMCIDAQSGHVQWKIQLEGRVECSAAFCDDFSKVVVGCYKGNLYFINTSDGKICWTFKTSGEVKSQPVVDSRNNLIWCGSHDHHLYALDYINYSCRYKVLCGGSVFGSPVIDEVNDVLYVASTSGRLTAVSIMASPFEILWVHELEAPVFGSLAFSAQTGNIICCLVDGHVLSMDSKGSVIWKHKTSGPIFAGACISSLLPSQVLICSRNGSIFSFELEMGKILWEYNVRDPITSSAYVDEHTRFTSDSSTLTERSGSIVFLRVNSDPKREAKVEELARIKLDGDIFSSPVLIGGKIFVGCRDNYVHCLALSTKLGDVRVYIVSGLFFTCIVSGGVLLGLYMFLPENQSSSWYPLAGMVLVSIPWAFWFFTFMYRCVRPGYPPESGGNNNAARYGGGGGGGGGNSHREPATVVQTVVVEEVLSESDSPPAVRSPSVGGGERRVQFGAVVVLGNQQGGGVGPDRESSEISNCSRESEIPLRSST